MASRLHCARPSALNMALVFVMSILPGMVASYEVTLTGVADESLSETLRGGSLLVEGQNNENQEETLTPQEIVSNAQADYKRLLAVLYDNGYFGPEISIRLDSREASSIVAVTPPARVDAAVININPGRPFTFGVAEIGPLAPETQVPKGFASGEPAQISQLQSAARAGVTGWRDAGHAKAEVADQQIIARHGTATIDAEVTLEPGPKLTFGPIVIEGESNVRRERIRTIADYPEGAVFSPEELDDVAARLRRTGAFKSVAVIESEQVGPDNTLPITMRVVDNLPRRFGFGGELASIEGLTLNAFWLHRNLFGGAESLRIEGEVGGIGGETGDEIDYSLNVLFKRPAVFRSDTSFFALIDLESLDRDNYTAEGITIGAGFEWMPNDEQTYRAGAAFRRATTSDARGDLDYTLFLLPTAAVLDYRDSELDPRRGYYLDAQFAPFLAIDGADNGLLTEIDARAYRSFGTERPTTLAVRAQLGSLAGPSLETAPADFLFYSGGGGTVRGQEYESLGVNFTPDEIIGGRSFLGLSAEVRMRTAGNLGFVGFFDAGYIGREAFPDGSGEWHSGAGIGVRYATPIGPIRFDLAVPVEGGDDGENVQFYIGIGEAF
ncbi:MAG: autotransporter assembly complex family protein [Pseudomonadota bacterium]